MAEKIKLTKKKTIKSGERHKRKIFYAIRFPLGFIILFLLILAGLLFVFNANKNQFILGVPDNIPLTPIPVKKHVLITPYPTISLTPTPVPISGFCLRVPILYYHHIQPESVAKDLGQTSLTVDSGIFDQQMAYLISKGYTPIWANELIQALTAHTSLPEKPIMVTMDDGYADNYTYALPVLEKYHIKANLMLSSGLVGSNPDFLTWDMVNGMQESGLYYFTNHTWSHWPVTRGPQNKIEMEIDTAKAQIQQHTGQVVNIFTYPYGSFNTNVIQTLQKKGYIGAFSTIPGFYQCDSFIMSLHRNHMGNAPLYEYGL